MSRNSGPGCLGCAWTAALDISPGGLEGDSLQGIRLAFGEVAHAPELIPSSETRSQCQAPICYLCSGAQGNHPSKVPPCMNLANAMS